MDGKAATLATLRGMNAVAVLETIALGHPISRAEVARRTGMSKPTASHALGALLQAGLVRHTAPPADQLHYGAVFFEPAVNIAHVLGIDVGTVYVRGAVADLAGNTIARYDHRRTESDADGLLRAVSATSDRLLHEANLDARDVAATGVAVAGIVDPADGHMRVSSEPALEDFPIRDALSQRLPGVITVDNDVNLAALGELASGCTVDDFAFLAIGSGVGAGLVLNGQLRRGYHGAAGEVDYPGQNPYAAGSPAADAFIDLAASRFQDGTRFLDLGSSDIECDVKTAKIQKANATRVAPEVVFAAARAGDPVAAELIAEEARRIAGRIAMIALVVDVPLVVLGGGIGLGSQELLEPIQTALAGLTPYPPQVRISALGDAAVLAGAVSVAARTAWPRLVAERLGGAVPPGLL